MAFGIGKDKDKAKTAKKQPDAAKSPKAKGAPVEQPAPQVAPALPAAGDQRNTVVRGGKKGARRKGKLSSSRGGTRGGNMRSSAPSSGSRNLPFPTSSIQDVILKAFPTLAKALGKEVKNVGKAQKRSKKPQKPSLPIVNLLPPRFTVVRERNTAIKGAVISGLGLIFAAGTMYVIQGTALSAAQGTLNASQAQIAEATGRLAQYGDVGAFFDQVQQRLNLEKSLKSNELDFITLNEEIQGNLPLGTVISEITITPPPKAAEGAPVDGTICGPKADPFSQDTRVPVACIVIKGSLPSVGALTQLNDAFADSKFMFNVLFVQGERLLGSLGPEIDFVGTIAVSDAALLINTNLTENPEAVPGLQPTLPIDPNATPAPVDPNAVPVPTPGGNN